MLNLNSVTNHCIEYFQFDLIRLRAKDTDESAFINDIFLYHFIFILLLLLLLFSLFSEKFHVIY